MECAELTTANVVSIVEGVLRTGAIDPADDFYGLAGTSLQAVRICVQIKQRLGIEVSPEALFDADSIADFAAAVTRSRRSSTERADA